MFSARFSASAVFPCDGRAARMSSSEGCQAGCQLVQLAVAGRHAGDAFAFAENPFETFEIVANDVLHRDQPGVDAIFREREDGRLGVIEDGVGAVFAFKRALLNVMGRVIRLRSIAFSLTMRA